MFCPNCRSEYRAGFDRCKDCDVGLLTELPSEEKAEFVDLVEVLSIADAGQIALVKSILEAEEIPYLAQGENFNLGRNIAVRFLVPRDYLIQAREILDDFV
jgi:Putative prokaryotic signal transducing protein